MSTKDDTCAKHRRRRIYRRCFATFLAFIILVLLVVLVVWLVLRPTKPRFVLQDATVYQFNLTSPNLLTSPNFLTSVLQVTINSRNPNDRIGIYYDRLDVYASYRNQQITLAAGLPPSYQGHKDIIIWSPYLSGANVPVSPYIAVAINQDQSTGNSLVNVKINGHLRWKVGSWTSNHYHISVNCPAYMRPDSQNGNNLRLQFPIGCSVNI